MICVSNFMWLNELTDFSIFWVEYNTYVHLKCAPGTELEYCMNIKMPTEFPLLPAYIFALKLCCNCFQTFKILDNKNGKSLTIY